MTPDHIAAVVVVLALVTISISFLHEVLKSKAKFCRENGGHKWESVYHERWDGTVIRHRCTRCGRYA